MPLGGMVSVEQLRNQNYQMMQGIDSNQYGMDSQKYKGDSPQNLYQ